MTKRQTDFRSWLTGSALKVALVVILSCQGIGLSYAHHVLGRPAYSLNEDSNTPPSMNLETQVGDYFVTAMVYPAFPRPKESGRINFYAIHVDSGAPLSASVAFKVREDSWFSQHEEKLGAQVFDDNVYRQAFVFKQEGDYIISAEFQVDGEHHVIDFPLRVGERSGIGPLGVTVAVIVVMLVTVSFTRRRRLLRIRLQAARNEKQDSQ